MTETVSLGTFEAFVRDRRHEDALSCLAAIAGAMERGNELVGLDEAADHPHVYARLAGAMTALFADPKLRVSDGGARALLLRNRVFAGIFAAGGFRNADHVLGLMRAGRKPAHDPAWAFRSLVSLDDAAFCALERMQPTAALRIVTALLTQRVVTTERAENNRARLLALGPHIAAGKLRAEDLDVAATAWMLCSYTDTPSKHDFKAHLGPALARLAGSVATVEAGPTDRPVLAVLAEHFTSGHAMFRCYARSIEQLRRDFHVVLFSEAHRVDAEASSIVDEIVEIDPTPAAAIKAVRARTPRVVYYPSVGMAPWTVVLANVRLAPIQVMSLGHPATARAAIDYVITEEDHAGDPADYSETLVLMDRGGHPFVAPEITAFEPSIAARPDVLRLAVPSNALKLSWRFLAACRSIHERASRPVEFHFFPNLRGVTLRQVEAAVADWVPNFVVHPPVPYDAYRSLLDRCDLHLSTFPFGGTNSNVDTMRLGIPMVALDGAQSAAAGEVKMLRRMGVAEGLVVPDVETYVARVLELITDDDARVALGQQLLSTDADAVFCRGADATNTHEFADTMKWIADHHDTIQQAGRDVWTPADRAEHQP